jgi:hypothetical protein
MKRPVASSSIKVRSIEGWKEKSKSLRRFIQGRPEKCRQVSMTRWRRAASSGSSSRPRKWE